MKRTPAGLLVAATMAAAPSVYSLVTATPAALARTAAVTTHKSKSAKTAKYKGAFINFQYGGMQATIVVKGKKIKDVKVNAAPDSARGQFIDSQADPILRQETLKAQSANVGIVSGATQTSEAYMQSLQSAISSARSHRALK